jgi:thiol-disulfide isomerase/thioredoxin
MKRNNNSFAQVLFVAACILMLTSCKNFKGYKINGTIKQAEGVKVYLEDLTGTAPLVIDTASVKNDKFELKNYASKGIYRLRFGDDAVKSIFLFIEEKDKISITADLAKLEDYKVEGSVGSASIKQLNLDTKLRFNELDSTFARLKAADASSKDSLEIIFNNQKKAYVAFIKDFIEKEKINEVACFGLNYLGPMMQDEIPYLVDITEKLHTAAPDSKYINVWYKETQQYRDALLAETQGGVALNTQAPNIILQNPNGDSIQLKNLLGKYVLVDFWASWCQPCRMENPNVVALYKQYQSLGFEVFSVSLDANEAQWKKAIEKDGLIWKNHGCDFGGWQSAPAQAYSVQSIPATFLLDKSGKVIAKNLRGEELAAKLAELFAAKTN